MGARPGLTFTSPKMPSRYHKYDFLEKGECYGLTLLPSIICLGRLRIACRYIFNLWHLREGVDSLAQWLEHWICTQSVSRSLGLLAIRRMPNIGSCQTVQMYRTVWIYAWCTSESTFAHAVFRTSFLGSEIQSTLIISNSKGPSELLRDIRTSTYKICKIEEKIIWTTTFNKYTCNWTLEVRDILKILWKRGEIAP